MGRNDNYKDLTSLSHWKEAEARLKEGASSKSVAQYIHRMGEMLHVKEDNLARKLRHYRARFLRIKALSPTYIDQAVKDLANVIDDVEELTKLIIVQKQRVSKDLKMEQNMPKLAPWLLKEIQALFDFIERRARLLQDLGVLYKAPDKHMVAVFGDDTWARLLDTLDEDQRVKAREIVQMEYAQIREQETLAEQQRRGFAIQEPDESQE